jgi:hypothetical protein
MNPIPPGMTDILHPLATAVVVIVIFADVLRKAPRWLGWVLALLILALAGLNLSGMHLYVPARIGDPLAWKIDLAVLAAGLLMAFRLVRNGLAKGEEASNDIGGAGTSAGRGSRRPIGGSDADEMIAYQGDESLLRHMAADDIDDKIGEFNAVLDRQLISIQEQKIVGCGEGGSLVALEDRMIARQAHQQRDGKHHRVLFAIKPGVDRAGDRALEQPPVPQMERLPCAKRSFC